MTRTFATRQAVETLFVCAAVVMLLLAIATSCSKKPEEEQNGPEEAPAAVTFDEFIALRNRAAALMGRFEYAAAVEVYEKLAETEFADRELRVDMAIATLNRQQSGDTQRALAILEDVIAHRQQNSFAGDVRARYCAGLLLIYERRLDEAIEHLRYVTQDDPHDAYAACWLGQCLVATGKTDDAEKEYRRAVEADPYLRSGYYGLAQVLQRQGKADAAREMLDQFERLKDNPQARLADFKYMRMGPKAEIRPHDLAASADETERRQPPAGRIFAEPVALPLTQPLAEPWQWTDAGAEPNAGNTDKTEANRTRPGITACDINHDGKLDLFAAAALVRDGRTANAVLLAEGERFRVAVEHPLAAIADVRAALWGDYDNDGRVDVYLCRRGANQLWRQDADDNWSDVTESTKTAGGERDTVDGMMFDADHDGDLDLFLVNADGPNELLSNNLDGTFRPLAESQGIAGDGRPSRQVLAADLDNDRDLDLIVLHDEPPHDLFLNDRLWNYRRADDWQAFCEARIESAIARHGDAFDQLEILSRHGASIGYWICGRDGVRHIDDYPLMASDAGAGKPAGNGPAASSWAVADVRGAGAACLLARHERGAGVWSTERIGGKPVEALDGLAEFWALCNFDVAAGPAIVDLPPGEPPRIWRPGPGRFPFVGVSLSGRDKKSDQMRSNASGVGAALSVRIGRRWTAVDALRTSTAPGQSQQPLAIGTRGAKRIDFINITWSDGVFQTEMDLDTGKLHRIEETQRQLSSCPVLFAWNGREFAFVTDALGVGGLGFNVGRGEYAPPRPWENLLLDEHLLRPHLGRYVLKLGEPMEEVCYLDALRLAVYDLPPNWHMTLDERFGERPPLPTGRPIFYRRRLRPLRAFDADGRDVTRLVRRADGDAVTPGEPDGRFIGLRTPHALVLEFGQPLDAAAGDPVLVLDGWIEYPYSQTTFAAWQAGAEYESASLDAHGADGRWQVVHERFGYPAGMPRQVALPIDKSRLPRGTTALRIRANVEVYWDAASIAFAEACPAVRRTELPLAAARLNAVGFARRTTFAQRRPHYDYARRSPAWDARHPRGMYTAFGPVEPLLAEVDDAVAIFGPGEEVHVEFAAEAPPLANGWTRRHVVESFGWCKDMDLFTRDGEAVEPLPRRDPQRPLNPAASELHRRFQTRPN